ncbi:unnamed protein product [Peronospora belbahrii]|uniref:Uncharacterized protein n=1 Tax=Peronospora belbahrii TaxID=622444 RepID=A0AAU9KT92_9STRA|nr:unnamed protein product [Peronospora belbahrii]
MSEITLETKLDKAIEAEMDIPAALDGGAMSWSSKQQSIVALSTAEAEYVSACAATMEAVSEQNVRSEVLTMIPVAIKIGIDSQSAYLMAVNPTYSKRTRHIEKRRHFVREQVKLKTVQLEKVPGQLNTANAFTKALDKRRLHVKSQYGKEWIVKSQRPTMTETKLFTKDDVPANWNGKFWHTYFEMMKMTFQDMDDSGEHWDVACGRIKAKYLSTDEGKLKLAKMEHKLRRTILMSL